MVAKIRRVVMGEPTPGMSVFTDVSDVPMARFGATKGRYYVWGCDELPQYPYQETEPYIPRSHFPPAGGVRVFVEATGTGPAETEEQQRALEQAQRLIAVEDQQRIDGSKPGMHQTSGLDIGVVISGAVTVTAEDGTSVTMGAGDIYIQPGALHQWHPDPEDPAVVVFVVLHREDARPRSLAPNRV